MIERETKQHVRADALNYFALLFAGLRALPLPS